MEEMNAGGDYLGAGLSELPFIYGSMSACFFIAACAWAWVLFSKRASYVSLLRLAVGATVLLSLPRLSAFLTV
jgi:cell division protein FtsX